MNSAVKLCLTIVASTIVVYITYRYFFSKGKEGFFSFGMRYSDSKRLLDITDDRNLSNSEYAFDMTPKQRFELYVTHQRRNIIKHPRSFDLQHLKAQHNIQQSLINDFYLAARFALIAYQTDPNIIAHACRNLGATVTGTVNDGNVYVYAATLSNNKRILCIQGTEFIPGDYDIYQVWSDLSITPRFVGNYADMYVHSGFYDDINNLWPQISNLINIPRREGNIHDGLFTQPGTDFNEDLWIIGHSLGAVRSMLIRSLIPTTTKVRITVFGCPRGASKQFYDQAVNVENTIIEQVVAERDFAYDFQPILPYYHANPYFYWLTNDSIYYTKERDWLNLSMDDHSIQNSYLTKLAKLAT
jgi:hypothetical protein